MARRGFIPAGGGFALLGGGHVDAGGGFVEPGGGFVEPSSGRSPNFAQTAAEANSIVAPFGAAFSNAYTLDELSGNAVDLFGAIALVPQGTPTQGVLTGLPFNDRGVQIADNSAQRMQAAAAGDFNPGAGPFFMFGTVRLLLATSNRALLAKYNGTQYVRMLTAGTGEILFALSDGTSVGTAQVAGNHAAVSEIDFLAIRDKAAAKCYLTTQLGDAGEQADASNNLTNTGLFCLGRNFGSASQIWTWFGYGTSIGTLPANRVAALAAYRAYRGA